MTDIFVSYKTDDRARVERLVEALRDAGFDVWWDQDIPPGGGWRETIVRELDACRLCIVAWSAASTGESGRFVREEAERSAGRGAYLGVLIDPVAPPFGFGEWQAVDLSGWKGRKSDPRLARFIDKVRERLAAGPAATDRGSRPTLPPRRSWSRILAPAVAVALVLLIGLVAWRFWPARAPAATPTAFVNQRVVAAECSWLQISNVAPAGQTGERIALAGIAASPESLQTAIMRSAIDQSVPLAELDVRDVATSPPQTCGELEWLRRFRWQGRSRLTVIPSRGELQRTRFGWSGRFEYEADFAALPPRSALLGLDTLGGVKVLIPDLHAYRREHEPLRSNGSIATYVGYYFDDNQDTRNVGLILMTADGEIDVPLVEAIGREADRAFIDRLDRTAAERNWQFELALVRCGFEGGERRQC